MDLLAWLQNTALSTWLRESESIWALPTALTVHTLGLAVLVGASWVVDLRLLGVASRVPLVPLQPFFRVMWIGFWINAVTGTLLFAADATRKGTSVTFLLKMIFVAIGVATMVLIKRNLYGRNGDAPTVGRNTKLLAAASLVVWAAAITAGRLLAYMVEF